MVNFYSSCKRAQSASPYENNAPRSKSKNLFTKSANVFLSKNGSVKLGDLNVSKILKKGLC